LDAADLGEALHIEQGLCAQIEAANTGFPALPAIGTRGKGHLIIEGGGGQDQAIDAEQCGRAGSAARGGPGAAHIGEIPGSPGLCLPVNFLMDIGIAIQAGDHLVVGVVRGRNNGAGAGENDCLALLNGIQEVD